MDTVFDRLRRYLLIWALILIVLIILTFVVYSESFIALFSNSVTSLISGLLTFMIMFGAVWYLLRSIFTF